jgi:predicted unusual protein kinase regulating ubiquinone biosynthesis (AarF/ABC1/UbiB family)
MLIKNNYVHADCHGGNIFAKIYEKPLTFITGIKDYLKYKFQ